MTAMERRRHKRRDILETFSLFVTIPKKGDLRFPIQDVSEQGIGFLINTEGEESQFFQIASKEKLEIHFYLNQSLYLPLVVEAIRVSHEGPYRRVGGLILEKESQGYRALQAFLQMLDQIVIVREAKTS